MKLGILPGSGGTQRLPRVVGASKAVRDDDHRRPDRCREALQLGLVDEIVQGDLLEGAVAFAKNSCRSR